MSKPEPMVCDVDTRWSFQHTEGQGLRMVHSGLLVRISCENNYV